MSGKGKRNNRVKDTTPPIPQVTVQGVLQGMPLLSSSFDLPLIYLESPPSPLPPSLDLSPKNKEINRSAFLGFLQTLIVRFLPSLLLHLTHSPPLHWMSSRVLKLM